MPFVTESRSVQFYSDGVLLAGDLMVPPGPPPASGWPAVVFLSGFQGFKDIHPARFSRAIGPSGYAWLSFDCRGFGCSDGTRGRYVLQEQVEDARAAVSFLEEERSVDCERIALVGWAMGGGVAVVAASDDDRVHAVAAVNAFGDGARVLRGMHDQVSWEALMATVAKDRRRRARVGVSQEVPPFDVVRLDEATRGYVEVDLYRHSKFQSSAVTLESVDWLVRFRPELAARRISPRPLLIVHAENNQLHPVAEAVSLHAHAREPKHLEILKSVGHTEWMYDSDPTFKRLTRILGSFLAEAFDGQGEQPLAAVASYDGVIDDP